MKALKILMTANPVVAGLALANRTARNQNYNMVRDKGDAAVVDAIGYFSGIAPPLKIDVDLDSVKFNNSINCAAMACEPYAEVSVFMESKMIDVAGKGRHDILIVFDVYQKGNRIAIDGMTAAGVEVVNKLFVTGS